MVKNFEYDLIVIGSGPGGEGAAMQAAKQGLKVALVEEKPFVGGNCTHLGTIPSKALRHIAHRLTMFQNDTVFFKLAYRCKVQFKDLLTHANEVIDKQVARRQSHYFRNDVDVFHGRASFCGSHEISIDHQDGNQEKISAKIIILAMGSRPFRPVGLEFDQQKVFDSDTILNLEKNPKSIVIYGAGVIGCEYASIFKALGLKVILINTRAKLLNFLDDEISDALSYHLRDKGVIIVHNETLESVDSSKEGVHIQLSSGKNLYSDALLVAIGRTGNTDRMGFEELGIEITNRGLLKVNEFYQTSISHIYAVGDLTGFPSLASSAYDQGRFAASHAFSMEHDNILLKDMPIGIYTTPEISCIGKTESQLTEEKIPYEIGHVAFKHLARAQIIGQTAGVLKILFHPETLEILGIHCFGHNASEIIHIGQAIMVQKAPFNNITYFVNTTFNYPTMAEAYRVAALNGLNKIQKK